MSLALASALSSSSIVSGSRREIAVVEGFRFGNAGSTACLQSKYSVTSRSAQKRRSASSERKRGIRFGATFLPLLIHPPLPSEGRGSTPRSRARRRESKRRGFPLGMLRSEEHTSQLQSP